MKKLKKFATQLSDLIEDTKIEDQLVVYCLAHAIVSLSAGMEEDAELGLNKMFELISVAAGEQGYKFKLENHTVH